VLASALLWSRSCAWLRFRLRPPPTIASLASGAPSAAFWSSSSPVSRRLRPNLVLATDGDAAFVEDAWVGCRLSIGDRVVIEIRAPMPRCVMVDLPQTGLAADRGVLATLASLNNAQIGVVADVIRVGCVGVGDPVRLVE
jgi:uncharacterized protein YcbX